jgi:hypothetical protein
MREDNNLDPSSEIMPSYDRARYAVERARKIVKENNEFIARLKEESNIEHNEYDSFGEASNFSYEDSYAFDLYKIKSSGGITDFIKDIFGVH